MSGTIPTQIKNSMAKEGDPARFTDIETGYSVDTEDQRTEEEVFKDMEKAGTTIKTHSKKPPNAF